MRKKSRVRPSGHESHLPPHELSLCFALTTIPPRLLSPETALELEKLASSSISDMDFTRFTNIIEDEITKVSSHAFHRWSQSFYRKNLDQCVAIFFTGLFPLPIFQLLS
jgi:hypothetical protein